MEVFRAFGPAWDTFESGLGDRGSIAGICSREAMTASLASTYYPSLSSFTCQETGCPLWSMERARSRGGLGPPEPAPRAPLRKAAGGAFVPTKTVRTYTPPTQSVGVGHKPRALAHGYSLLIPSGFRSMRASTSSERANLMQGSTMRPSAFRSRKDKMPA